MVGSTVLMCEWSVQIASGVKLGAEPCKSSVASSEDPLERKVLAGESSTVEVLPEDILLETFDYYKLTSTTVSWSGTNLLM